MECYKNDKNGGKQTLVMSVSDVDTLSDDDKERLDLILFHTISLYRNMDMNLTDVAGEVEQARRDLLNLGMRLAYVNTSGLTSLIPDSDAMSSPEKTPKTTHSPLSPEFTRELYSPFPSE